VAAAAAAGAAAGEGSSSAVPASVEEVAAEGSSSAVLSGTEGLGGEEDLIIPDRDDEGDDADSVGLPPADRRAPESPVPDSASVEEAF